MPNEKTEEERKKQAEGIKDMIERAIEHGLSQNDMVHSMIQVAVFPLATDHFIIDCRCIVAEKGGKKV